MGSAPVPRRMHRPNCFTHRLFGVALAGHITGAAAAWAANFATGVEAGTGAGDGGAGVAAAAEGVFGGFLPWCARQAREVGASLAGMNVGAISAELVKALKNGGIGVFAWTADDDWIFEHLIKADVDGIITNYPERLVRFLGAPVDK